MIRVIVADDHPVVRGGVRRFLEEQGDLQVVGEVASGTALLELLQYTSADVLLLDVSMPGPPFLDLLYRLQQTYRHLRVLVFSVHAESEYVVHAVRAGAAGYLTKESPPREVIGAIRRVHLGGRYVSLSLADKLRMGNDGETLGLPHESLSDREYQVLCLLGSGLSRKEAASRLGVSVGRIGTCRGRILAKMHFASDAEIMRYVLEHRLRP